MRGPRSAPRLAPWAGLTRLWLAAEKETFGEEREVVRVEAFNQFVEWFGPIKDGSSGPPALLERVRTTLSQRYTAHTHTSHCDRPITPTPSSRRRAGGSTGT